MPGRSIAWGRRCRTCLNRKCIRYSIPSSILPTVCIFGRYTFFFLLYVAVSSMSVDWWRWCARPLYFTYSSGIVLLDQRSAGDPSFLLYRGSCILPSTYLNQVPRQPRAEGSSNKDKQKKLDLFFDHLLFVVEAPLHLVVNLNKVSRSQPSFLPARFHTRLAFWMVALPSVEPCSRLDGTGALPELEQVRGSWSEHLRQWVGGEEA